MFSGAGRDMKELKYSEILKQNSLLEKNQCGEKYEIALVSNIVIAQLKEIFEYSLRSSGVNASVSLGDYDNIVQDSLKYKNADLIVVFWEAANIIDGLQYKAETMGPEDTKKILAKTKEEIDYVLENLMHSSMVIINRFSSLAFNHHATLPGNFDHICAELNAYLADRIKPNMFVLDVDRVCAKISIEKSIDLRYYYSSKVFYTVDFYKEYVNHAGPLVLSANGKAKKALIFDCDNTLWKGILGEDGIEGIKMSGKHPDGVMFEEVQYLALCLSKQGVLIGICSKNNQEDVDEVINNHPDMMIRDENIAIKKINWQDKVANLTSISKELNIGLDSLVFVDDSAFEANYIRESLPQVTVLQVPQKIHDYPAMIRESRRLFLNISRSKEDGKKIEMYKQQEVREKEKRHFATLQEYLKSLGLTVAIHINDAALIPRMAQLTQKTNQFNLTTKRYTETAIRNFVDSATDVVFSFQVNDKYGDYGVVGLAIVSVGSGREKAEIDSFLMSCRVIGRNVELAFFDFLISHLKKLEIHELSARYIKSPKNQQVAQFYESVGFKVTNTSEGEKNYLLNMGAYKPNAFDYIGIGVKYGR